MDWNAFVQTIKTNKLQVFGAECYVDGQPAGTYGDTVQTRYPIYSAVKSITSIAAGIAADAGKLDLDASILRYLPETVLSTLPPRQLEAYRQVTMKRLMTMSVAGYPFRPEGKSWLRSSLCIPLEKPEDRIFQYSNVSAYLASVCISCAVEEDLACFLNRELFAPLGIDHPPCAHCPDGWFYGASKMALTVNELSRIGLMLYNGGVWQGQRILSQAYVREATSLQQANREEGYGYFFWKYRSGFYISGKWEQKCYILPEESKVITYLSHIEKPTAVLRGSMEAHLL